MVKLQKKLISGLSQNDKPVMIHSQQEGVTKIKKLISSRKVLLVLDDVKNIHQLNTLGINPNFFQAGSRIIVTTRDKRSLGTLSYVSYNTSLLNHWESIELFTRLTYKQDEPIDTHLVNEIAYYSSGLPLVLEVWSRHFTLIEKREQWPNVLKKLKAIPHDDVQEKLRISYDSLTNRAKKLFLNIACFFDEEDSKELIIKVLHDEESAFFPDIEIQHLVDRGLVININSDDYNDSDDNDDYDDNDDNDDYDESLQMHHVIREMGQEIVRQEKEDEPGQRTRLMNHRDVLRVLEESSGTQSVESIRYVESIFPGSMIGHIDAFRKMNNLRLIRLNDVVLYPNPRNPLGCDCEDMSPLSFPKLKYLEWNGFRMESINIDMCNVVVVKLRRSRLRTLWKRTKRLEKLKILDVSVSNDLTKTGNFIGLENLEVLDFSGCRNLEELDSSVWCLDKLVKLDLYGCTRLKRFPGLKMELGKLASLEELDLSDCVNIGFEDDEVIKDFMSSLKETHITFLKLRHCKICKVPSEVGSLTWLKHLDLYSNVDLLSLPDSLVQLDKLETIDLRYCSSLQSIPDLPRSICSVRANGCECLTSLPSNMAELTSLRKLDLSWCKSLTSLPSNMAELTSLRELILEGCISLTTLPSNMGELTSLRYLFLEECECPNTLPLSMSELTSLKELHLDGCSKLGIEDPECLMKLTGLTSLTELDMRDCNVSQVPSEFGNLVSLRNLHLSGNTFCSLPDSFGNLLQLRGLWINRCSKLTSLPLLPPLLTIIEVKGCVSLDVMRSAYSVVIYDLCCCPTTPALNMTNHPYYKISKCVLAEYKEASFHSRLQIHLSDEIVFPIWCHNVFGTRWGEFMAPEHLDRSICGIIICLRTASDNRYYVDVELQNKTKGKSYRETGVLYASVPSGRCIKFIPLVKTTVMLEAGDTLAIDFEDHKDVNYLGFGVCLIYKEGEGEGEGASDEMEAVEPTTTTTPFNFNPISGHLPGDDDDEFQNLLSEDHRYNITSASDDADFQPFFNGEMEPTTNQTTPPFNFNSITNHHELYNLLVQDEEYLERLPWENYVDYSDLQITELFRF